MLYETKLLNMIIRVLMKHMLNNFLLQRNIIIAFIFFTVYDLF